MSDTAPVIDETKLNAFGVRLFALFGIHEADRKAAEDRWLQNLRQFRGIYDPEVLAMIPKDCSKAYPKLTRWKIIGTVARLMQMLFPQTEKNYGIRPSPLPDLSKVQMQEVLDTLVNLRAQEQGIEPTQVELQDEEIEKAVFEYAAHKAERMELKIADDLDEMEFITLARKVVFSATLYNVGILAGPLHTKIKARSWMRNQFTGRYEAKEIDKFKPLFEFDAVWDHYPDMTAKTLDQQDGAFDRHIMTRAQVEDLAKRPDFLADRITKWLNEHKEGNYKARWWETEMKGEPKSDKQFVAGNTTRKYETLEYWGGVTGHELRAAGVTIADEDIGKTFQANVWTIDNIIIKAKLAPFDADARHYHYFVFEDDDLSLLGNGQSDTLRDSQLSLCEVTRAALDNASVIGPMVEVNMDLIMPGTDTAIRKHKSWPREGEGAMAQVPAVRNISVESHLPDLLQLRAAFLDSADKESGLPPPSMGDVSGGGSEALRTQGNASMFLGAAALPIRDTVRNFDSFTMSVINALVKWNMKYDPNPTRDGDFNTIARGSTSLIAKEVLAASLDAVRQTVTPDEAPHIKTRELLKMRLQARDVPVEMIMEDEDKANQTIEANRKAQQSATEQQQALIEAQVNETLAKAVASIAKAHKDDASINQDAAALLVEALGTGHANAIKEKVADKPKEVASGNK